MYYFNIGLEKFNVKIYYFIKADLELRATIMKVWPVTRAGKIDLLVPTEECEYFLNHFPSFIRSEACPA